LIIEEHGDDAATRVPPSAPTPTVGTVQIAARNQLQILNLKGRDMLQVLSHWVSARAACSRRPGPTRSPVRRDRPTALTVIVGRLGIDSSDRPHVQRVKKRPAGEAGGLQTLA